MESAITIESAHSLNASIKRLKLAILNDAPVACISSFQPGFCAIDADRLLQRPHAMYLSNSIIIPSRCLRACVMLSGGPAVCAVTLHSRRNPAMSHPPRYYNGSTKSCWRFGLWWLIILGVRAFFEVFVILFPCNKLIDFMLFSKRRQEKLSVSWWRRWFGQHPPCVARLSRCAPACFTNHSLTQCVSQ